MAAKNRREERYEESKGWVKKVVRKKAVYRVLAKLKLNRIEDPAHSQPSCSKSENDRTELKLKYEQSADIAMVHEYECDRDRTHHTRNEEERNTHTTEQKKSAEKKYTLRTLYVDFPFSNYIDIIIDLRE